MQRAAGMLAAAIVLMSWTARAQQLRHPAGIVLSIAKNAEIRRANTDSWIGVRTGILLFSGDALKGGDGAVSYAICPDLSVNNVLSGKNSVIPEAIGAGACDLPETTLADAAAARGGDMLAQCSGVTLSDLVGELHAAAKFRAAGDRKGAADAFQRIVCSEPGAGWARGVLSRLKEPDAGGEDVKGETFALLIGISKYADKTPWPSLEFGAADAISFSKFLMQKRGGSVPESNILLLTDEKATRARIDSAIDSFVFKARKKENTLVVFIAGHGDYLTTRQDAQGHKVQEDPFFVTYDSSIQDVKTTGFPMARIKEFIVQQAASFHRVIAFVDICHAGYSAPESGLPAAVKEIFDANNASMGVLMATAPQPEAFAYESPTFGGGHGAFTYGVLWNLINGKPLEGHKELSLSSLYAGTTSDVIRLTNGAQIPVQFSPNPQMSVLDDATVKSEYTLGEATPLSEASTRRRRGKASIDYSAGNPVPEHANALTGADLFAKTVAENPMGAVGLLAAETNLPAEVREERAEQLRVALEDRGQQILVRYLRGEQAAMDARDFDLCNSYFHEASQLAPLNVFDESRALFCGGRSAIFDSEHEGYKRAIPLLEQSILLDPEHAYAYNALGIAYLENVRYDSSYYDRAAAAFRDATRFAPRWVYPLHNLALTFAERGDFSAARRTYLLAIERAKYYSYLPYNLGLLYQSVNQLDEAEKYYRQAIATADEARRRSIEPASGRFSERALAWNALATVEMARHNYRRALDYLERAREDDPVLTQAKYNRARILSRAGRSDEAEQLWKEAIAIEPENQTSRIALAQYLERNGRLDEALQLLSVSNDLEGHRLSGRILMRRNQTAEAIPHLEAVRSQAPGDARAQEAWADAAVLLGMSGAGDGYRKAVELYPNSGDQRRVREKLNRLGRHGAPN